VPKYEVCVDSLAGVRIAREAGADRIELCAELSVGGLTPSIGLIERAVELADDMLVHVLIRPRSGDFVYAADEIAVMKRDIDKARHAGAAAIVTGALTADGTVDTTLTKSLIDGGPATFHRAFDHTRDPAQALDVLIDLGIERVLTSGQQPTALAGAGLLAELHRQAAGRITILAGGGITERNVADILERTGVSELHFSGSEQKSAATRFSNPRVRLGGVPSGAEDSIATTSARRVKAIMAIR
jgi:copper homeostasis protein